MAGSAPNMSAIAIANITDNPREAERTMARATGEGLQNVKA
jgi:hypothetical protein